MSNTIRPALLMFFRDEADILEDTLQHWKDVGIEKFYLCDNGSKDNSSEIAYKFTDYVPLEPQTNWPATAWINSMKKRALDEGYNWIFPVDADEKIILGTWNDLHSYLNQLDKTLQQLEIPHAVCEVEYLNILPTGIFSWQEPHRKVFGKMAYHHQIVMGNHYIEGVEALLPSLGVYYEHRSIRSLQQFTTKMKNYMIAFNQMPFATHPHAESYHKWQEQGDDYITNLYYSLIGES